MVKHKVSLKIFALKRIPFNFMKNRQITLIKKELDALDKI